jgi:peptidyl-prolyl cis-trans isomerase SurA
MKKIGLLIILSFCLQFAYSQNKGKDTTAVESLSEADKSKKEARDKIESYRQRVLKGESMSALAKLYSEDPGSAKEGGCYKDIPRGTFVPEFEDAVSKLKPGELSEVFETQYGFHFVQLLDRRGEVIDVRHILVKMK